MSLLPAMLTGISITDPADRAEIKQVGESNLSGPDMRKRISEILYPYLKNHLVWRRISGAGDFWDSIEFKATTNASGQAFVHWRNISTGDTSSVYLADQSTDSDTASESKDVTKNLFEATLGQMFNPSRFNPFNKKDPATEKVGEGINSVVGGAGE